MDQNNSIDDGHTDEHYLLDRATIRDIRAAVETGDTPELIALMDPLHGADIADLLEQISPLERRHLVQLYDREFDGEILSELDEGLREEVIDAMAPQVLADAVRELESDDVVDLIEDLEEPQQEAILEVLEDVDRVAVEAAMAYPEFSAGRLMQREVVSVPDRWNVGQAIDFLRRNKNFPEQFYHVHLVNPRHEPVAYVTLGRLLASKRDTPMLELTEDTFRTFDAQEDEADVAYAFNQYHLISSPVIDANGRLVGMITIDDAVRILDEEHEEDIMRLAGVGESSLADRVFSTTRRRFPWLAVNLVTAILASLVIAQFDALISQFVALAVLMPIVASMGGNAGTQSLTVAVRAIATRDLTGANVWRVIRREVLVGLVNGVIFAIVMGVVGAIWFGTPILGVVIALAMLANLVVAGFAGIVIPVALEKAGIDPALASGAFVTTVTDVVGFAAFLGLAAVMLI